MALSRLLNFFYNALTAVLFQDHTDMDCLVSLFNNHIIYARYCVAPYG